MVIPLLVRRLVQRRHCNRIWIFERMSSTDSSKYLISNSLYKPFLNELGLEEENVGVFDGKWFANGEVFFFFGYFFFFDGNVLSR